MVQIKRSLGDGFHEFELRKVGCYACTAPGECCGQISMWMTIYDKFHSRDKIQTSLGKQLRAVMFHPSSSPHTPFHSNFRYHFRLNLEESGSRVGYSGKRSILLMMRASRSFPSSIVFGFMCWDIYSCNSVVFSLKKHVQLQRWNEASHLWYNNTTS